MLKFKKPSRAFIEGFLDGFSGPMMLFAPRRRSLDHLTLHPNESVREAWKSVGIHMSRAMQAVDDQICPSQPANGVSSKSKSRKRKSAPARLSS